MTEKLSGSKSTRDLLLIDIVKKKMGRTGGQEGDRLPSERSGRSYGAMITDVTPIVHEGANGEHGRRSQKQPDSDTIQKNKRVILELPEIGEKSKARVMMKGLRKLKLGANTFRNFRIPVEEPSTASSNPIQSAFLISGIESNLRTINGVNNDFRLNHHRHQATQLYPRRTSGRVCAQIRPGRQGEAVHVDLHEIEVQTAVERESRKRKATVSRPTQEDDDDFVNPPQRNNVGEVERESGKRKATVSLPTQEGIHMSISQKLRGKSMGKRDLKKIELRLKPLN
ncbi:hypothetical protein LXL04_016244 [Taraxacum kok-saghyz]